MRLAAASLVKSKTIAFLQAMRAYACSDLFAGAKGVRFYVFLSVLSSSAAVADNPTYYAQWGAAGDPVPKVCIHYTTPGGINPWYDGSIQYPTRVDGAIGTPNYQLPIVCGGDGAPGKNADSGGGSTGGYAGYVPLSISATLYNNKASTEDAIVYMSMGGWGGGGGNSDGWGQSASTGGTGAKGGDINLNFLPGSYASFNTNTATGWSSAVFIQSTGGSGGDGGSGGGNGGIAGVGGSVSINNQVNLSTNSYGIFAQSLGGWGGSGTNGNNSWWYGGNGGSGSAGGSGGSVSVTNSANITSYWGIPIFAQSVGGNGGNGGNGSGGWFGAGGSGGAGGYGGPGAPVAVTNSGMLYATNMTGSYGIFAQSVGGGGGNAGATADLNAIGASGGYAASAAWVGVRNSAPIYLGGMSSVGIFAQSVGGGGGAGGMAIGMNAIGGSGGEGGSGNYVSVGNTGSIYTGNACYQIGTNGQCTGSVWYAASNAPITSGTNGGAFGILAQSIGGGGGSGGTGVAVGLGSIAGSSLGGSGGGGGNGGSVYVGNTGTIQTREINSAGILAQSIGGGGGSGGGALSVSVGLKSAFGASNGGDGGPGGNGGLVGVNCPNNSGIACAGINSWTTASVPNSGAFINTNAAGSPGILAQSIGGGGGNGGYAATFAASGDASVALAFGGSGGAGGYGSAVYASPAGVTVITTGSDSSGVQASSIGGGGGNGGQSIAGSVSGIFSLSSSMGGTGGSGGKGGTVNVVNAFYTSGINGQTYQVAPSSITTYGDRSYGLIAQSIGGGGGSGGASINAALAGGASISQSVGGSGGAGQQADTSYLWNDGSIKTSGSAASAIVAQSIGGGGGNGGASLGASASMWTFGMSVGGSGGSGGNGSTVNVTNNGVLTTTGGGAPVILAQSIGGGGGNGGATSSGGFYLYGHNTSIGGTGASGAAAGQVNVTNYGSITANNSTATTNPGGNNTGILAQSIGGGGGNGGYSFGYVEAIANTSMFIGGTGGAAGTALDVNVWNMGSINIQGANSAGILAQSIGGAGGNGGTAITGSLSGGAGFTTSIGGGGGYGANANAVTVTSSGLISTWGSLSPGIALQSIAGSGGNGGLAVAGGISLGGNLNGGLGGKGGWGGWSGNVIADVNWQVTTTGDQSPAILAQSMGGAGGNGGNAISGGISTALSGTYSVGGDGGGGGDSGSVTVNLTGNNPAGSTYLISTNGLLSPTIVAQSIAGSGGNGGLSLAVSGSASTSGSVSIGGNGALGGTSQAVDVNVTAGAYLLTSQAQSPGILAQSIGGTGGNGGLAGGASASSWGAALNVGGTGGAAGDAGDVNVSNNGTITSKGVLSPGILAQSVGGTGGNGGYSIGQGVYTSAGITTNIGGGGGVGGQGGTVTAINTGSITTSDSQSSGIIAQSIGGSGGNGGLAAGGGLSQSVSLALNMGGSGGSGGQGLDVHVDNTGVISASGSNSLGILAQSIGGSGGNGGNVIGWSVSAGTSLIANVGGAAGSGNQASEVTVSNSNAVSTRGDQAAAIVAQSIGGTGGNGGNAVAGGFSADASGSASVGGLGGGGGTAGAVRAAINYASSGKTYSILTSGQLSPGVILQSIGGSGGNGGFSLATSESLGVSASVALGGSGGTGGRGSTVELMSSGGANIATSGNQSAGIIAQSIGGNGGNGGAALAGGDSQTFTASVSVGGSGGTSGTSDDVAINLNNPTQGGYSISTKGLMSSGIIAQSISGQGGNGGTTISGSLSNSEALTVSVSGSGGDAAHTTGTVVVQTGSNVSISTLQDQSVAILAQSIGGSGGNAGFAINGTASLSAATASVGVGGSGGSGGNGNSVTVNSNGAITTSGAMSSGIVVQSIGGGGGNGGSTLAASSTTSEEYGAVLSVGVGGSGGVGGVGGVVTVTQSGNITTGGCDTTKTGCDQSSGIIAQSIGGGGGNGGFSSAFALQGMSSLNLNLGGRGGSGGEGGAVTVQANANKTTGTIGTTGAFSNAVFAQSVGGGGGAGGFTDAVTVGYASTTSESVSIAAAVGGSGGGGGTSSNVIVTTGGILKTEGNQSAAVYAQSIGGGGGKGGSSFSFYSSKSSTASTVAGIAASYGAGLMGIGSGGSSSSSSGDPLNPDNAPSLNKSESQGSVIALSVGGYGGSGGYSAEVTVTSASSISTTGDSSQGIFAQSVGGGGGSGGTSSSDSGSGSYVFSGSLGGFGGAGGWSGDVNVTTSNAISTTGLYSAAIYAQSIGGGGGQGGSTSSSASSLGYAVALGVGGWGGVGNTGGNVTVNNKAQLITESANSAGIYAQSVGGGGGDGGSSLVSAKMPNPPLGSFVPEEVKSFVGSLTSSTKGKSGSDAPSNSAAGESATQKGSQAGGSDAGTAIGISIGGYGGTGGNSGVVSVTNSGLIATGTDPTTGNLAMNAAGLAHAADYSYAIFAQSVGGGGGFGGQSTSNAQTNQRSVSFAMGGGGAGGGSGNEVLVNNTGALQTNGSQASAIFAQSVGGGGGVGGDADSTSNILAAKSAAFGLGGSGADGGSGGKVTVTSSTGAITTYGLASNGIFAQSVGGGGGNGGSSSTAVRLTVPDIENVIAETSATSSVLEASTTAGASIAVGLGGKGGSGGNGGEVSVSNSSKITTAADSSVGIFAQSVGGGGGSMGSNTNQILMATYSFSAQLGMTGTGGNGGNVSVGNYGAISTSGQSAMGVFAQSLGGGGGLVNIVNSTSATSGDADITVNLGARGGSNLLGGSVTLGTTYYPLVDWITTKGTSAVGLMGQSIGGGGGVALSNNMTSTSGTVVVTAALGAVADSNGASLGGNASVINAISNASISTSGDNAPGMLLQSVGGGGGFAVFNNAASQITSLSESYVVGAQNGSTGGGAAVTFQQNGSSISTLGANAIGVAAQSIGGGGGLVLANNASSGTSNETASENIRIGGSGSGNSNGGSVSMIVGSSINTGGSGSSGGANSIGIAAQSIGGGGGMLNSTFSAGTVSLNSIQIGGASGVGGDGSGVSLTQSGAITSYGPAAIGIVAQSVGGGGGYAALASLQGNTTISNSTKVTIGGSGGVSGNGGDVNVTVKAPITTYGKNSVGVIAQSVGGGGGILLTSGMLGGVTPMFTGGTGNGGSVTVDVNAPIKIYGAGVYGVIAQSIGGGGGMVISENGVIDGSGKGGGEGGAVTVNVKSSIYVNGQTTQDVSVTNNSSSAYGVYAKSIGTSDPSVTVAQGASVVAAGGSTAIALDGLVNQLTNHGVIVASNPQQDTAVKVVGAGGTTEIINHGYFSGPLSNDGSVISLTNKQSGRLYLTNIPNLGSGILTNEGYLQFGLPGQIATHQVNPTGEFVQSSTGILGLNLNFAGNLADRINVASSRRFDLAGKIQPVLVNAGMIHPGEINKTILNTGGLSNVKISDDLGVAGQTAIMSYSLSRSGDNLNLHAKADFAPAGLSQFGSQVGQAIGQYQSAGSNAFFQAATAQLVEQPTVAALDQAYQGLAGTAIQAVPQVMFQAVSQGVGSYTDRMNDWRVSTATAKSSRMAAFSQPQRYASAKSANSLVDAANDDGLIGGGRSGPWVSLFQSNVFSKSLTDRIVGGTIGFEMENDRRSTIGGIGVTLSQSGYSYNNAPTPITPGNTTNVGLSFYGMGRGENAYLSGIGYLGGGNSSFTRQLQTMNFYSSTNVSLMSYVAAARIESGYSFEPFRRERSNLQITPFVAVQPTYIHQNAAQDNFSSMGLGTGFNYSATDNTAVPVFAGLEFSGNHMTESGIKISPFVRASWMAETKQNGQMGANYNGQGVNVFFSGSPNLGNAMLYKVGSVFGGERVSGYFTLDYDYGNASYAYRNYGVTGGIKYAF